VADGNRVLHLKDEARTGRDAAKNLVCDDHRYKLEALEKPAQEKVSFI
jgi:hypothetical protein